MIKKNKVVLGDCLEVMKKIDDKSIDMILCDLPYGTTACKWDVVIPFEPLWKQYNRIIKENGAIVLTASQPFTTNLINSNKKYFKYCWYWKKTKAIGFQHSKNMPMKIIENICVFSINSIGHESQLGKKRMNYFPQGVKNAKEKVVSKVWHGNMMGKRDKQIGKKYMAKTGFPNDLLEFKQPIGKQSIHPTQKPVSLFEYLIKTYTNEGDLVLDNCAGSGTTAIACINTNRNYICIEKEPKYVDVIRNRIFLLQKERKSK